MKTGLAGLQLALLQDELEAILGDYTPDLGIWQGAAAAAARSQAEAICGQLVALVACARELHGQVVALGA